MMERLSYACGLITIWHAQTMLSGRAAYWLDNEECTAWQQFPEAIVHAFPPKVETALLAALSVEQGWCEHPQDSHSTGKAASRTTRDSPPGQRIGAGSSAASSYSQAPLEVPLASLLVVAGPSACPLPAGQGNSWMAMSDFLTIELPATCCEDQKRLCVFTTLCTSLTQNCPFGNFKGSQTDLKQSTENKQL